MRFIAIVGGRQSNRRTGAALCRPRTLLLRLTRAVSSNRLDSNSDYHRHGCMAAGDLTASPRSGGYRPVVR